MGLNDTTALLGFHWFLSAIVFGTLKDKVEELLMSKDKTKEPTSRAVKISIQSYDLVVADALRKGVQRNEMVTIQQTLDELIKETLGGKPKPELKE